MDTEKSNASVKLNRHALVVLSKKKNTIKYVVYSYSTGLLSLHALNKLKGSEYALLVDLSDGSLVYQFTGTKGGFPTREKCCEEAYVADVTLQSLIRDDPLVENDNS